MGIHSNVVGEMSDMDKRVQKASGIAIQESASLFAAFSNASAIGLAPCDKQLRYQAINSALAAMNGVPAKTHLGNSVHDILGDVAAEVEPSPPPSIRHWPSCIVARS